MRLLTILILGVSAMLALSDGSSAQQIAPNSAASTAPPRSAIALFRYRGARAGSESGDQFDAFRGLIEQKIHNIINRIEYAIDPNDGSVIDEYVQGIYVRLEEDDNFSGPKFVRDWIRNEGNVLQAFRGTIFRTPRGSYEIRTRCHLVEDPSVNKMTVFSINLALTAGEFANTKDSHSLIILYSIAIEAKRIGMASEKIAKIVSDALNIIADLERRNSPLNESMLTVKKAWEEFQNAL